MDQLLYDIFLDMYRQGPGDREHTEKAFSLLAEQSDIQYILDVGCGTGTQTLDLASISKAKILAVDNYPPFLDRLNERAREAGFHEQITCTEADMAEMSFPAKSFDLIWCEGAVYVIGLAKALDKWKSWLKPGACIVVSEFNWMKPDPPREILDFYESEAPWVCDREATLEIISSAGFECLEHFTLADSAWKIFYEALQQRIDISRNGQKSLCQLEVFIMLEQEIDFYHRYREYFGYEFYIMRRLM